LKWLNTFLYIQYS